MVVLGLDLSGTPALICGAIITLSVLVGAVTLIVRSVRGLYRGWRRCDRALVQILGEPADPDRDIARVPSLAERFEKLERRVGKLESAALGVGEERRRE